ncbi:MAG: 50S ribosomal protein L11 methyltransferase [Acidobacteria bacterium]|nr:50S ribosomal protein L11 methyltransferase [Acidobacteriota bacterium]
MQSGFIEVSIRTNVDSGELLAMLNEGESLGSWEENDVVHIYWPKDRWNAAALENLKEVLNRLGVNQEEADLHVSIIPDQDWNKVWAASLQPILLGRRFRIRQSWHKADPGFKGIELVIDPKRAFGTGYHATTQLILEWLEDNIRGGERILDVGTGTGILAMAAIRLGASSALAIDNDPVALECACEYAESNGFGAELELRVASFESLDAATFDVIVANLDGKTMPCFCGFLRRKLKNNGFACLSGLQEQDYRVVAELLDREGLLISERRQKAEWLALTVQ